MWLDKVTPLFGTEGEDPGPTLFPNPFNLRLRGHSGVGNPGLGFLDGETNPGGCTLSLPVRPLLCHFYRRNTQHIQLLLYPYSMEKCEITNHVCFFSSPFSCLVINP